MHRVLRDINQMAKGLSTRIPRLATTKEPLVQHPHVLFRRTSTQQPLRDFGVPNPSWRREMMDEFEKFTKLSEEGLWERIPSYDNCVDSLPGGWIPTSQKSELLGVELHPLLILRKLGYKPKKHQDTCLFVRNVPIDGCGFEFAMFYNPSERRMVVLLQPGSYLEGMIGYVHGGAVAAILDHTFASCGMRAFGIVLTANLSVNYKSSITLGSVVLVETKVEKVEENKIFMSGSVQSIDAQTLHAKATGGLNGGQVCLLVCKAGVVQQVWVEALEIHDRQF